jgi:hypothetical protein
MDWFDSGVVVTGEDRDGHIYPVFVFRPGES